MKNKFTDWLDGEWRGRPRSHWLAWVLVVGIVINCVVASFLRAP